MNSTDLSLYDFWVTNLEYNISGLHGPDMTIFILIYFLMTFGCAFVIRNVNVI